MNFSEFEKGINEAPNYSPERLKAHADKAEKLRQTALAACQKNQKFLDMKNLGGQQLDNAEEALEAMEDAMEAYFDHIKTAP
jgi:hypothetical protein